jgi:hypothetical protein
MARKDEIDVFFKTVDNVSERHGLYSEKTLSADGIAALEHDLNALCAAFFDKRREENIDITTLRSDRTQLRNAARKRYEDRPLAYSVRDSSKKKPVFSERYQRMVMMPVQVHPVMGFLDISWEEKDEYFQTRRQQILQRTGEGTRLAENEILITSVDGIKKAALSMLNYKTGDKRDEFYALILGLTAATGRRIFEICAAAMGLPGHDLHGITQRDWKKYATGAAIDYLPRCTLWFSGQMKTGQSKNPVRQYPIYGLVQNKQILTALGKLKKLIAEGKGKEKHVPPIIYADFSGLDESEINKRVNSSTSGDLGEFTRKHATFFECLERGGKPLHPALFVAKMTRNLWGHCLYAEYAQRVTAQGKTPIDFPDFARPLYGHTGTDVTSEYKGFRVKGIRYNFL